MTNLSLLHQPGVKPAPSLIELGRGVDGIVVEVQDHPELVAKDFHHRFRLGQNRLHLEQRILEAVRQATAGAGATAVFNGGSQDECYWLVRERVFDAWPRGEQADRELLVDTVLRIHPMADISRFMLPDPTFDNIRWGYTAANPQPRWILIDP